MKFRRSCTNSWTGRGGLMSRGIAMLGDKKFLIGVLVLLVGAIPAGGTTEWGPRVIGIGVNGMEWDIIRPLLLKGELHNFAEVVQRGVYGKMKTLSAPNCPKVYSSIATGTPPEENGITGFVIAGKTASTDMLRREPLWSILSTNGVTVGMAN